MWAILIIVIAIVVWASKKQQQANQDQNKQNPNEAWNQSYQTETTVRKSTSNSAKSGRSQTSYSRQTRTENLRQHADIYRPNQTSQSSMQKNQKKNQQTVSDFWQNQTNATEGQADQNASEEMQTADRSKMSKHEILEAAGVDADDGAILAAAKVHSFMTELDNDSDSQEDLMQPVYDLMIKGPDTSITFERDFVGEATDMLNNIQPDGAIDESCLETTDFDSPYVI